MMSLSSATWGPLPIGRALVSWIIPQDWRWSGGLRWGCPSLVTIPSLSHTVSVRVWFPALQSLYLMESRPSSGQGLDDEKDVVAPALATDEPGEAEVNWWTLTSIISSRGLISHLQRVGEPFLFFLFLLLPSLELLDFGGTVGGSSDWVPSSSLSSSSVKLTSLLTESTRGGLITPNGPLRRWKRPVEQDVSTWDSGQKDWRKDVHTKTNQSISVGGVYLELKTEGLEERGCRPINIFQ